MSENAESCNEKTLGFLIQSVRGKKIKDEKNLTLATEALLNLAQNGNAPISRKAGNFAYEIYTRLLIEKRYFNLMENRESSITPGEYVVETMARYGGPECLPILKHQLQREIKEGMSLEGIVRLGGKSSTETVMKYLNNPIKFFNSFKPALHLYNETKDEMLLKAVFAGFETAYDPDEPWRLRNFAAACAKEVDQPAAKKAATYIQDKTISEKLSTQLGLAYVTGDQMADELYRFGLVDKPYPANYLARLHREDNEYQYSREDGFTRIDFLQKSGICIYYDSELMDESLDTVMSTLLHNDRGRLKGVEFVANEKIGEEDYSYVLALFYQGKAYLVKPNIDYDDWYDIGLLLDLLNRMLKEQGIAERYCTIEHDPEEGARTILFGENEKVKKFVDIYFPESEKLEVE